MYFYRNMFNFMPMPNAAFGSSFASGIHCSPFRREKITAHLHTGLVFTLPLCLGRCSLSWRWVGLLFGVRCYCSLCSLGAACCWSACLLCAVLRFCLVSSCYNWRPVLVRVWPAEGNRFALGTGGIRWSLLVGGLGPVVSIPKLCFKPFRRLSAVGFVLGWHREPHLITTLQAPFSIGYCRTHGGNHRGWTSCGDR